MLLQRRDSDSKHLQPDGRLLGGRLTGVVDVIGSHNRLGLAPKVFKSSLQDIGYTARKGRQAIVKCAAA